MTHSAFRTLAVAVVASLLATTATGCSTDDGGRAGLTPGPQAPAAIVADARQRATSQFETDALQDGKVSREEYDEAHQLWLACMQKVFPADGAVTVSLEKVEHGLYQYVLSSVDDADQARFDKGNDTCSQGTIANISSIYNDLATNPDGLSEPVRAYRCLDNLGKMPHGYSETDFEADWKVDAGSGRNQIGPIDADDEDFISCVNG